MAKQKPTLSDVTSLGRLGVGRWCLVAGLFLALYLLTSQPGVSWQDNGFFQYRVAQGEYTNDLGLALAHPLYIASGRAILWLGGEKALPALFNAFSGLCMAVALATLAGVCTMLTSRKWIGLLVAAMLGLSHTIWWHATIAETYAISLAGLTVELYLLILLWREAKWWQLVLLALVSGLGVCVHNFALLPLPVYLVVMIVLLARRRLPAWSILPAFGAYLLGAGIYLGMIVNLAIQEGSWIQAVSSALVGNYSAQVTNVAHISKYWKENFFLSAMNFANPMLLLAVVGWVRFRRHLGTGLAVALGAITFIEILFFIRYSVPDQVTFILPTLLVIALGASVGLAEVTQWGRPWRRVACGLCLLSLIAQPAFYAVAPNLARRVRGSAPQRHAFRNEWRYWLVPWKQNEDSAKRFSDIGLSEVEPNAMILLDSTALYPMKLTQKIHNYRPDVNILSPSKAYVEVENAPATFREHFRNRPIYFERPPKKSTRDLYFSGATFRQTPRGSLYQVHWPAP